MLVHHLVVTTVNRRPTRWTSLQCGGAHPREQASQPTRRHKASMRKQAVIADAYGERRREVQAKKQEQINLARPKPQPQETAGV